MSEKKKKIDFAIGGQAVIEGVMMRSPHHLCIAVRRPNGEILVKSDPFNSLVNKYKALKSPVLRGIIGFFEMLVVGIRAINFSSEVSLEEDTKEAEEQKLGIITIIFVILISLAFGLFLFKYLPLLLTEYLNNRLPIVQENYILYNLIDGVIKISFFVAYIFLISLSPSIKRVFQYHGAEHKSIFTYEKGKPLTPIEAKKHSCKHPRCGTSFILIVFVISILIYTVIPPHPDFLMKFLQRIAILPIIAGVAYEFLKISAKYQDSFIFKLLIRPGLWLQKITTQEPDLKQLEVALAALKKTLELEKKHESRNS